MKILISVFLFILLSVSTAFATPNPDVNRDGKVDWIDFCVVLGAAIFKPPIQAENVDINQDGIVDEKDLILIRDYPGFDLEKELLSHEKEINYLMFTKRFPGDINQNGIVNVVDLTLISKRYGQSVEKNAPEDINGDGFVGQADFNFVTPLFGKIYFIFSQNVLPVGSEVKAFTAPLLQKIGLSIKPLGKTSTTWASIKEGGR